MHAIVATFQIPQGQADSKISHSKEVTLPLSRQQKGWRGTLVLVDRKTHKNVTIAFWDSEADLRAAERNQEWRKSLAMDHFAAGDVSREEFEVVDFEFHA